jgi:hypothetical protein
MLNAVARRRFRVAWYLQNYPQLRAFEQVLQLGRSLRNLDHPTASLCYSQHPHLSEALANSETRIGQTVFRLGEGVIMLRRFIRTLNGECPNSVLRVTEDVIGLGHRGRNRTWVMAANDLRTDCSIPAQMFVRADLRVAVIDLN